MRYERITISVPTDVAAKAQRAADAGLVDSVSGYFTDLANREPDWAEARAALSEMLDEVGGVSPEADSWARGILGLDEALVPLSPPAEGAA
ncbi:hypothetical protein [Allostreptomyces psammosilenae]|uniref:Uncharacterized protein n=1 Tax=Allostreptomyces psammosilenae TaxID=1892865 RepID=A0A853A8D2_9ACTN|nr:hypothetical protein [Allostreptomyces psammosilenae]NYI06692.1 hypothetical protein [Allostreptomyces psammosilenae]